MPTLRCDGVEIEAVPGETVLTALERAGVGVASSCRIGACQACLVRATRGDVPSAARAGLKPSLVENGYFLACQAVPQGDLDLTTSTACLEVPAKVAEVTWLSSDVVRVLLSPDTPFSYRAGQFVTLVRQDGLARAYSLASSPARQGELLELHVRVVSGGAMSNWLANTAALGSHVHLRGPAGECFYMPRALEQTLVLVGTGTGLAPLWGVLRDALQAGHAGPIELWHGARTPHGLYLRAELEQLAAEHSNFAYRPCALEQHEEPRVLCGSLDEVVLRATPSFAKKRVYLCGDPGLVQRLKRAVFLAGAALSEIHADAFVGNGTSAAPALR